MSNQWGSSQWGSSSSYTLSRQVIRDDAGPVVPSVLAPRRRSAALDESATSFDPALLAMLFDASRSLVVEREVEFVADEVVVDYSSLEVAARRAASFDNDDQEPFVPSAWEIQPLYDFREDAEDE